MVILTMASVQEQGENEQKKDKSLMLYIAPAHQDRRMTVHCWNQYYYKQNTCHQLCCEAEHCKSAITYNWFYS